MFLYPHCSHCHTPQSTCHLHCSRSSVFFFETSHVHKHKHDIKPNDRTNKRGFYARIRQIDIVQDVERKKTEENDSYKIGNDNDEQQKLTKNTILSMSEFHTKLFNWGSWDVFSDVDIMFDGILAMHHAHKHSIDYRGVLMNKCLKMHNHEYLVSFVHSMHGFPHT